MTSNLHPYHQLAEDPTSEAYIAWVDADTSRADHNQSFEYREKGTDDEWEAVDAEKIEIPEGNGEYKHEVFIDGLDSDTIYEGTILCDDGFKSVEFKTLPSRLWRDELTIVNLSDIHLTGGYFTDETEMDELAAENPDIFLFSGDLVHNAETNNTNANGWIDFFSDYYSRLDDDLLVPMAMSVGNHEVEQPLVEDLYDIGSQDPTLNYFQIFFSNVKDLDPQGENFGVINIGNYLQIFILDTMSAVPIKVRNWIDDTKPLAENVLATIAIHHQPILAGGQRTSDDVTRREALRDELGSILGKNDTIKFSFGGHVHLEKQTKPWTVVDEEPSGSDYLELKDGDEGYIVIADSINEGITEFGDGYRNGRTEWDKWYLEYSDSPSDDDGQFEVLTVTQDELKAKSKRFNNTRSDSIDKQPFNMKTNTNQIGFVGGL